MNGGLLDLKVDDGMHYSFGFLAHDMIQGVRSVEKNLYTFEEVNL